MADEHYQFVQSENSLNYLLRLPVGYDDGNQHYPLLVFLHGLGEKGNGSANAIQKVAVHGPFRSMQDGNWDADLPLIVAGPQVGGLQPWWPHRDVLKTINALQADYRIDPRRIYLTGLSMGGRAVWEIAEKVPGRAAAIIPVAGWAGQITAVCGQLELGVWAFHGSEDGTVKFADGQKPIDAMNACDPGPRVPAHMTRLEGVAHNNWDMIYENRHGDRHTGADGKEYDNIYRWLLTFRVAD
ncbi:MAG: hypothetical protein QNJ73_11415 [Gammaproteobacteria bacterium]|nr:hypothetical protein [Gammaproteobacteria bacterium]